MVRKIHALAFHKIILVVRGAIATVRACIGAHTGSECAAKQADEYKEGNVFFHKKYVSCHLVWRFLIAKIISFK